MSSSEPDVYEPKYTSINAVPLGTRDRPEEERRAALKSAEARLESDVNAGEEIDNPRTIHASAVENLATYYLLRPATGPNEKYYGDAAEYGSSALEYVRTYKEEYNDLIATLANDSDAEDGAGADDGLGAGETYQPATEFETY